MRQLLIVYWLAVVSINTIAQPTFENLIIDVPGENIPTSVIELDDGYLICATGFESAVGGWVSIRIFKTDNVGNLIWQKYVGKENFGYSSGFNGSFKKINNGEYVVGGRIINSAGTESKVLLVRFNEDVDTLWTRTYGYNGRISRANQVQQTSDGGFALFGWTDAFDINRDFYLVKTDSSGNFQWEKKYGGGGAEVGISLKINNQNELLMAGTSSSFGPGVSQGYYFLKTDSLGNIIYEKTYGSEGEDAAARLALLNDGFILWGGLDTVIDNSDWRWAEFIAKFDMNGNIKWRTFVNKPKRQQIWQIRELDDGSIVFVGEMVYQGNNEDAGWIGKLDANGNVLWERFHLYKERPFFDREVIFREDFKPTSDGGFIVTGNVWRQSDTTQPSIYTQHIWLVKLDSLGCLNGDCGITVGVGEVPSIKTQEANIVVYPNPFKHSALVSIRANQHPNKEVVFQLYDTAGRLIRTQRQMLNGYGYGEFQMPRGDLPEGVYFYSVVSKDATLGGGKVVIQ